MRRTAKLATVLCALVTLSGAITAAIPLGSAGAGASPRPSSSGPCGTLPLSATQYNHVIWVWMENHSYGKIIGSAKAPSNQARVTGENAASGSICPAYRSRTDRTSVRFGQQFV